MPILFRTQRLTVRTFAASDAHDAFAMCSDPAVCRYTGDEPASDLSAIIADVARWASVADRGVGCGFWAVDADTVGFIGDVYVRPFEHISNEHEIGWHSSRPYWGRGYATEVATATIEHAHAAGIHRLVASIDPAHQASLRVAKKAGLLPEGLSDRYAPGEPPSAIFTSTLTIHSDAADIPYTS